MALPSDRTEINKDNSIENEESNKQFKDNNFPNRIVIKVNKSSYIITTMQSLAQIKSFSTYFINKKIAQTDGKIDSSFKDYMENLWSDEQKNFVPKDFMTKLVEITKRKNLLTQELEPYVFYDYILKKLGDELKGRDKEIKNYFTDFANKYKNYEDKKLEEYIKRYIKRNNSIVSKTFYGIMKISSCCDLCSEDEKEDYIYFNIIDINVNDFCNEMHLKGNSLTNFSVEELIDYYFGERIMDRKVERKDKIKDNPKETKCPKCQKECGIRIEKKIIELPNYLVIRINWGDFVGNKGFNCKKDYVIPSYEYLDVDETIKIKEDYFNYIAFNDNKKIEDSVKFHLISTIGYFIYNNNKNDINDRNNNKLVFISKYRAKEEGKWISFWCNNKTKENLSYTDNFTTPCLLFYEKFN